VVVSAGNNNMDACEYSPAFAPKAITVGATGSSDTRASYSNFGKCVNIMAPGSGIKSLGIDSDSHATRKTGTSMACPHVSGAAALVLEADPSLKYDGVLSRLRSAARRGFISGLKSGDPDRFLRVDNLPSPVPSPSPSSSPSPSPSERRRRRRRRSD
jgi:subtilisin family serine protease